jgi:hypothetical protein
VFGNPRLDYGAGGSFGGCFDAISLIRDTIFIDSFE